ncbi:MAG: glycosyltransferase [Rhodospirillales bacterium]|nr:glycosyltransferase [Rhodospirillales bacterium]
MLAHPIADLSPLHRVWRMLPAEPRRRLLAGAVALIGPRTEAHPPAGAEGLIVAGELSRASGLGEAARLMLAGLRRMGVPCAAVDIGPLLPAHRADLPVIAAGPIRPSMPLVLHVNPPLLPWVLRRLPRALTAGRRIIGNWAWELPEAPADWTPGARLAHEAWAPSHFAARSIEALLPGRVRVVSPPIGLVPPRPAPIGRIGFGLPEGAVIVLASLNLASSAERKNPLGAIAAFRAAFGDRADRLLLLKLGYPEHAPDDFAAVASAAAAAPNIRLLTLTLPSAESHALTAAADIVLSLHRSEGFGLVPAEAMALGKPVVATGWSGNMGFMDETTAAPIRYRLVPARDRRGLYAGPGSLWAEPDLDHAAAWLRRLADDPGLRARLGGAARAAIGARLDGAALRAALAAPGLAAAA